MTFIFMSTFFLMSQICYKVYVLLYNQEKANSFTFIFFQGIYEDNR